jgi:hypothetical protein
MSNIVIPGDKNPLNRGKDCEDFVPLHDGTRAGDPKYCDKSFDCRQIGMKSDRAEILDLKSGKVASIDYLCQGVYHKLGEMDPDELAK